MPKRPKRKLESVHARAKRAIEDARLKGSPVQESVQRSISLPDTPRLPIGYTFNWKGDKDSQMFIPRFATKDEIPNDMERAVVNHLAEGKNDKESKKLYSRILDKDPNRFLELMEDSIYRWHILPSKERR